MQSLPESKRSFALHWRFYSVRSSKRTGIEQSDSIRSTLPSLDEHRRAIDPVRLLRGEQQNRLGDIFGLADSTRRHIGNNDLLERGNPSGLCGAGAMRFAVTRSLPTARVQLSSAFLLAP
jgi:hypothetical protein